MTRDVLVALWQFAEYLELTEKGSKLYNEVKALLIEELKGGVK
jgi:hypothetical protein